MALSVVDSIGYKFSNKAWLGAFFIGAAEGDGLEPKGHYELLALSEIESRRDKAKERGERDATLEYGTAARAIKETVEGLRATPNDLPGDFQEKLFAAHNDDLFKVVDPRGDFDWTEFEVAQKTAQVKAEFVREGTKVETIMANGLHETTKTAGPDGGYRVTAQTGEQYLVDKAKFERLYNETETPGVYAPVPDPRKVLPLDKNVVFEAPWGGPMYIRDGGVLVNGGPKDLYGIQPDEFKASYSFKP